MFPCLYIHIVGTKYGCGNMKKIDLKPICCNLCMLWGNLRIQSLRLTPERKLDYFLQKYHFVMTK